jgi:NifB/MoaA-like Fe-S oxidoreductase
LEGAIQRLNQIDGLTVELTPVVNAFFGGSVTCAGLLTGKDILKSLENRRDTPGEALLLPSVAFKEDEDIFLDDIRLEELSARLGHPVLKTEATARGLVSAILDGKRTHRSA